MHDSNMENFETLGIDTPTVSVDPEFTPGAGQSRWSFFRGPWMSVVLSLLSVVLWTALIANLFSGPIIYVVLLSAGPLALAGTVLGVRNVAFKKQSRWVSLVGLVLGLLAALYVALEYLRIVVSAPY